MMSLGFVGVKSSLLTGINCTTRGRSGFDSCHLPGPVGGLVNRADLSLLELDCVSS